MIPRICGFATNSVARFNRYEKVMSFKTKARSRCLDFLGGCLTITTLVLIIAYGTFLFVRLMKRSDFSLNQTIEKIQVADDVSLIDITPFDDIEFRLNVIKTGGYKENPAIPLDEALKFIGIKIYKINGRRYKDITETFQSLDCEESSLTSDKNTVKSLCLKLANTQITKEGEGTLNSGGLKIRVFHCLESVHNGICDNPEIMKSLISYYKVDLRVASKYVDLNDFENPIKSYSEALDEWKLYPNIEFETTHFIQRQEVYLEDSLFPTLIEPEPIKFNKVSKKESSQFRIIYRDIESNNSHMMFSTIIRLSDEVFKFRRKTFTLMELVGTIGGIFEIFEVIFALILGILYKFYFKKFLASEVQKYSVQLDETQKELEQLKAICNANSELLRNTHQSTKNRAINKLDNITEEQNFQKEHLKENNCEEKKLKDNEPEEQKEEFKDIDKAQFKGFYYKEESLSTLQKKTSKVCPEVFLNEGGQEEHAQTYISSLVNSEYTSFKEILDTLDEQRDCLSILFRIRELEVKINYLLSRDIDYVKLKKGSINSESIKNKMRGNLKNKKAREKLKEEPGEESFHQLLEEIPNHAKLRPIKAINSKNKTPLTHSSYPQNQSTINPEHRGGQIRLLQYKLEDCEYL
ncbi:unnamed protein product [Moneuplotes crassus]|uniref:Uncharacterized protein n=1 Tax=Euplotes crassus TaxID=5936 RepID=A0AAD1UCC8_EUPCR|nr:unnamed protein product [Moneuplotes crassus]